MTRPVLLSGIQPSGQLTLGNYIGAIRNWRKLAADYDCLFMLVDMHAITVRQDPAVLRARCREFLALYLACGLNPEQNTIFVQSQVRGHGHLAWILDCYAMVGELNRMTQFKDKSRKHADNINAGLFNYPVLMAADILLYQTALVPVGDDQKQHLELTRDVAQRFNQIHGETFTVPEPFIPPVGARIMGLQEPTAKMSKSEDKPTNAVYLLDEPKAITRKIKRAVTDTDGELRYDPEAKPGLANLLQIYAAVADREVDSLVEQYAGGGYGPLKTDLADAVVALLEPVQAEYARWQADPAALDALLATAAEKANARAEATIRRVHDALGFLQ
ncbi:MAG: tryptophan--tRNA ligase [Oceanococcaceae bacterium]